LSKSHAALVTNYLAQYAILPQRPELNGRWARVMVVPCFAEPAAMTERLPNRSADRDLLVICVINRPDSSADSDANTPLRQQLGRHAVKTITPWLQLCRIPNKSDILVFDLEYLEGPTPARQGVGRARRVGCDLALWLIASGQVTCPWILSSDADARWPEHFLTFPWPREGAAFTLPFQHEADPATALGVATLIYEIWLHAYVRGLEAAQSPYAFHTLGSCCGFNASAYAAVRGVPLRAGGEDFYLMNKLAKQGDVLRPPGPPVLIEARASSRVPFGTGPGVQQLLQGDDPKQERRFYHPDNFRELKTVLDRFPQWLEAGEPPWLQGAGQSEAAPLSTLTLSILEEMGLPAAIRHARQHGATPAARLDHLSVWFDGFRTLKFIHTLRSRQQPDISYLDAWGDGVTAPLPMTLRNTMAENWGWQLAQ